MFGAKICSLGGVHMPSLIDEQTIMRNFSKNIRYLRLSKTPKLSQQTLARILGITVRSISRYETASCLPPTYILASMARYFGYTTEELLSEKLPIMKGCEFNNENLSSGDQTPDS